MLSSQAWTGGVSVAGEWASWLGFEAEGRRTVRANGQKELRHGLELVNAAAQQRAACFEKYEAAALRDGADQVRDSGMLKRLASADPENGRGTDKEAANSFMRYGMRGTGVQNLCGVDKID